MIATTTLLLPVVIVQALGMPIFLRSHCALNFGSLGMIGVGAEAALFSVRSAERGVVSWSSLPGRPGLYRRGNPCVPHTRYRVDCVASWRKNWRYSVIRLNRRYAPEGSIPGDGFLQGQLAWELDLLPANLVKVALHGAPDLGVAKGGSGTVRPLFPFNEQFPRGASG